VRHRDLRGTVRVAITCALCHAKGDVPGRGDRHVDLGLARALLAEAEGAPDPRFRNWGPGRIDVTDDAVDAPTAIPDLWGVAWQRYLNASGVIAQELHSPSTLAVRFETQYVQGHELERRPARVRMWALARFVLSLEGRCPELQEASDERAVERGRALFELRCASCHNVQEGYAGRLVAAELLTSDPTVAHTAERGTGFYKVPSLVCLGQRAPFLHDASQPSLESLLASGHPMGRAPRPDEASDLVEFLRRL
jgi:mono/diheme cytochrome c family protein